MIVSFREDHNLVTRKSVVETIPEGSQLEADLHLPAATRHDVCQATWLSWANIAWSGLLKEEDLCGEG